MVRNSGSRLLIDVIRVLELASVYFHRARNPRSIAGGCSMESSGGVGINAPLLVLGPPVSSLYNPYSPSNHK